MNNENSIGLNKNINSSSFFLKNIKAWRDKFLSPITNQVTQLVIRQNRLEAQLRLLQNALGRIELRQLRIEEHQDINSHEFQVYSQWGEDGIIQFLVNNVCIENRIFIEFGVEDYQQSNTKFLLMNNNWSGLVIDSSQENISKIMRDEIYWNYNLKAICKFISKKNINKLIIDNGLAGDIGLLSIDVDGNDFWIWEAINAVNPVIVIVEYNYRLGINSSVTIPYIEKFNRKEAHHSMIYFGASLKALCSLARNKGYIFIGCSSNGVNAFFLRKDKKESIIKELTPEEGYRRGGHCEFRNKEGVQTKMSPEDEIDFLNSLNLPLVTVEHNPD